MRKVEQKVSSLCRKKRRIVNIETDTRLRTKTTTLILMKKNTAAIAHTAASLRDQSHPPAFMSARVKKGGTVRGDRRRRRFGGGSVDHGVAIQRMIMIENETEVGHGNDDVIDDVLNRLIDLDNFLPF